MTSRLKEKYLKEMVPELKERLGYSNVSSVPALPPGIISIGLGEATQNPKALEADL